MRSTRKYTDEELRAAVESCTTFQAVAKRLGIGPSGGSYQNMRDRVNALGLSTRHFHQQLCNYWDDDALRSAVATSTSYAMVAEKLDRIPSGKNFRRMKRRIQALALDMRHFEQRVACSVRRWCQWTDEDLTRAVASSLNYADVIRNLGLVPAGGNYSTVQRRAKELGIDVSHLSGGKHRGRPGGLAPIPLEQVLVAGRHTSTATLKQRLFREGLKKPACEICGWAQQSPDGRIPVELDHINGDNCDNRLENLRILCPNCHSLQPTHRGLNQKRRRR